MNFNILPGSYKDVFEEDKLEFSNLLRDVPSHIVLSLLSVINSNLYLDETKLETQIRILNIFLNQQTQSVAKKIYFNIFEKPKRPDRNLIFFSNIYTVEFMHRELINFRTFPLSETNTNQELNFLKAYMIIVEEVGEKQHIAMQEGRKHNAEYLQKTLWPTFFEQFELTIKTNPFTNIIKALAIFNHFEFTPTYGKHVLAFLARFNRESSWSYIIDIMNILKTHSNNKKNNNKIITSINDSKEFHSIFENFKMDVNNYKSKYLNDKANYSGIKSKPLMKFDPRTYLVLDWHLLESKLYDGLIFDFYESSGISNESEFNTFLKFKNHISDKVIEKYLFQKLIKNIFVNKYHIIKFDDSSIDGLPDAYCRNNNEIYLFEIKDAYFPSTSINSNSYLKIKEAIDLKYNGATKGTGQIANQIKNIEKIVVHVEKKQLKIKDKTLFPIIIYTDKFFGIHAVNSYLNSELKIKIKERMNAFKKIKPVTLININFLIEHIHLFKSQIINLGNLISEYHKYTNKLTLKAEISGDIHDLIKGNEPFEVFAYKFLSSLQANEDGYINTIVETLELNKGLPD